MKTLFRRIWVFTFPVLLWSSPDHLIISEIVLQPSSGEYLKIYNPTDNTIDLDSYYLTDATDTMNGKYYYNLPAGNNFWSGSGSDFIARFPAVSIPAKGELTLALSTKANYSTVYGRQPDYSVKEDFRPALPGSVTIGGATSYLDNNAETLVLFFWDGTSATMQDVDYLLWGSRLCAISKTGISGYVNDTPVNLQKYMPTHVDGQKLQRIADEGTETTTGGNGITGHDETSENLDQTWHAVETNTRPKISNISVNPAVPVVGNQVQFSADVTDDGAINQVNLIYRFLSTRSVVAMANSGGNTYQVTVGPFNAPDTLYYYIKAEDATGLKDSSNFAAIVIQPPPEVLTIAAIRSDWSTWKGETVTLRGVVTIGSNILRTDRTSAYFQDFSGKGLNLYASAITNLNRGDSIEVTGTLDEYLGVHELTNFQNSFSVIASQVPLKVYNEILIADLTSAPATYEGSYLQINGVVAERADNTGGGTNLTVEDISGRVTVRIWNSTNALFNSLGILVNPKLDSLLQVGNKITVRGIGGLYNNAAQILLGYADEVEEYIEGAPGSEKTIVKVAPYPFVPQIGEVIRYTYEYPSNSRVIMRVYDMDGRFITTLIDEYHALSWHKDGYWDGRNELHEIVKPGMYLMHLETTNRTTGKTITKIAPVVVGVKLR